MLLVLLLCTACAGEDLAQDPVPEKKSTLQLSQPVACRKISGYEDYVVLEPVELTRDDKLLIYCKPTGHTYSESEGKYRAHLVEDLAIRRKGKQKPLWTRKKAIDFKAESDYPPLKLYLGTTVGLKGLDPGDYEVDLIVVDDLLDEPPVTATLEFKVIRMRVESKPEQESSP